jgi:hypothetical protein
MTYIYHFNKRPKFNEILVTEQLHANMYVYFKLLLKEVSEDSSCELKIVAQCYMTLRRGVGPCISGVYDIKNTMIFIRIQWKFMYIVHKCSVRASQRTQLVIFIKINWRLPCGAVLTSCLLYKIIRDARMRCVDSMHIFKALIEIIYVLLETTREWCDRIFPLI